MVDDNVNHPKHYTSHPSGVECITIVEHMNFNIGNAIKYLWRAGLKGISSRLMQATEAAARGHEKHIEDLKKAVWYINREIERLERPPVTFTGCDFGSGDKVVMVRARRLHDGSLEIIDKIVQEEK